MLRKFKKCKKPVCNCKKRRKNYKEYSSRCRFKFDLYEYPNEFDIELIERYGWYSENNPKGLSRDHMVSISYGWKKDIDPRIIRHPANCQLITYEENQHKAWKSCISIHELINKIKKWENKYKRKNHDTSINFKQLQHAYCDYTNKESNEVSLQGKS